jgi:hypothetical protein
MELESEPLKSNVVNERLDCRTQSSRVNERDLSIFGLYLAACALFASMWIEN